MADRHAGFAATVALSKGALDTLAKALYFAGQFDHWLHGATPGFLSSRSVSLDRIFLDFPGFELRHSNQGRIGLVLRGWGPVTVTPNDKSQPAERRDCEIAMLVRLTPRPVLVGGRMAIRFDPATASLDQLSIAPFPGSIFQPATQTYLDSAAFRALLQLGVQVALAQRGPLLPPFDISFLGPLAS